MKKANSRMSIVKRLIRNCYLSEGRQPRKSVAIPWRQPFRNKVKLVSSPGANGCHFLPLGVRPYHRQPTYDYRYSRKTRRNLVNKFRTRKHGVFVEKKPKFNRYAVNDSTKTFCTNASVKKRVIETFYINNAKKLNNA